MRKYWKISAALAACFATTSWAHMATEESFASLMDVAMDRMMEDMHVPSTGDPDADFVAMMVPHHQGAIDMAVAELRYGRDERLRRIAQEIIIEQQQEIAAMRLAVGKSPPPLAPAPTVQKRGDNR